MKDLDHFFERHSIRAEQIGSRIRASLAALALLRLVFFDFAGLVAGESKYWISAIGLAAAVGLSLWILSRVDRTRPVRPLLFAGASVDSLAFLVAFSPVVIWPASDYFGVLRAPDIAFLYVATIAAGTRLDRRVAHAAAAMHFSVAMLLIAFDFAVHPERLTYGVTDIVLWSVVFGGCAAMGDVLAARTRRLVENGSQARVDAERLGAYLSPEVATAVLSERHLRVGGTRRKVAILFSDLRGFTRYAESLPPERLVEELNAYLDAMVRVIKAEGGVVDKFVGDSIMAVFGAFESEETAAERAVRAAWGMQRALDAHNRERLHRGLPAIRHGIGVHVGNVVAGNIGNADRLQYTVIGDAVNLASRLESASKDLGVPVVLSREAVVDAGPALPGRLTSLGPIRVKGRLAQVEVLTFTEMIPIVTPAEEFEPSIENTLDEPSIVEEEITLDHPVPAPRN